MDNVSSCAYVLVSDTWDQQVKLTKDGNVLLREMVCLPFLTLGGI